MLGIRRREFIAALGGAAAWPLAARGQNVVMPVIGFLEAGAPGDQAYGLPSFRKGLSEAGFVENKNVMFEYQSANNQFDQLPALAAELVRRHVAVIVTLNAAPAARAAKAATSTIPIVFTMGSDPVREGVVASLNRPGGNITGVTARNAELMAKRLELLHQLLPQATRFGVFVNPKNPNAGSITSDLKAAASTIGGQIEVLPAGTVGEIDTAFASLVELRADAVLVSNDVLFLNRRRQIISLIARFAIPAISFDTAFVRSGGLITYTGDFGEAVHDAGVYAGRILKGEKPADLPVEQSTKFWLSINLKTAKTLGLAVPRTLLALANELVE